MILLSHRKSQFLLKHPSTAGNPTQWFLEEILTQTARTESELPPDILSCTVPPILGGKQTSYTFLLSVTRHTLSTALESSLFEEEDILPRPALHQRRTLICSLAVCHLTVRAAIMSWRVGVHTMDCNTPRWGHGVRIVGNSLRGSATEAPLRRKDSGKRLSRVSIGPLPCHAGLEEHGRGWQT